MSFAALAKLTLTQPDRAMAELRDRFPESGSRWAVLALACALSALMVGILVALFPSTEAPENAVAAISEAMAQRPLLLAATQFVGVTVFAALVQQVGRLFGGRAGFMDSLLALAWVDLLLVAGEMVQLAAILVAPMLAPILSSVMFGLMIYLFVRMVAAVHGFQNPLLVAFGIFGTLIVVGLVLGLFVDPARLAQLTGTPSP